jgi:hypothetical protein
MDTVPLAISIELSASEGGVDHVPGDPRNMRLRVLANGDVTATAMPVLWLLRYAYEVPLNPSPRVSGVPRARHLATIRPFHLQQHHYRRVDHRSVIGDAASAT